MSGDSLTTELGPARPIDDDTRQLAIAGVHRRVPAADVALVLEALGLSEPEPAVRRRLDGSVTTHPPRRICGCGKQIRTANPTCSACTKKPGMRRRTRSATGGDQ